MPCYSRFVWTNLYRNGIGISYTFHFLGYVISHLVKRYKQIKGTNRLSVLILPLIPFLIAAPTEHFLKKDKEEIIEVRTEQVFNYTPEQVYDAIKSVDTLDAEKPFLMSFDLPVPTKCVLEKKKLAVLGLVILKAAISVMPTLVAGQLLKNYRT